MQKKSSSNAWIVQTLARPQAKLRLFCFPYAGGGASIYYPWSELLPAQIEFFSIQPPGHENRLSERLISDLDLYVSTLIENIRPYLTKSYAFFGHSLGALISFEVARRLAQEGKQLGHLFVSGCVGPQVARRNPPHIHTLPHDEFIMALRKFNGTPQEVLHHTELMELMIPLLRADFEIRETYTYTPGTQLSCPITAFGGIQDKRIPYAEIEFWKEETTGLFSLYMFPGDHFFLHSARASMIQVLSRELLQTLSRTLDL